MLYEVNQLSLHIPHRHNILFWSNQTDKEEALAAVLQDAKLTACLELNHTDLKSCQYHYIDILIRYAWNDHQKCCVKRQRWWKRIIGQITGAFSRNDELFHPYSCYNLYSSLRTVNWTSCETFKQAFLASSLIQDNHVREDSLRATATKLPIL